MSKELFDIDAFRKQPLPSEEEVIAKWQGGVEKPIVSVLCMTFNQKKYIEDAFRGFLIQKTDFVFEVIVHDDASTDGTSDIVREYAKRYPKIFKPVIQTENQYSQGEKATLLSSAYAKGEYYALCEGDDYWITPLKLQKQYEALIDNPNIDICFTAAFDEDAESKQRKSLCHYTDRSKIFSLSEVVRGGGAFMPTASLMIRTVIFDKLPDWYNNAPVGDYYLQVLSSIKGGAIYLPLTSCVYRTNAIGSWSLRQKKQSVNDISEKIKKHIDTLNKLEFVGVNAIDAAYIKASVIVSRLHHFYIVKHDVAAMQLLLESCNYYSFVNTKQRVIYNLKNHPNLIRFIIKLAYKLRKWF